MNFNDSLYWFLFCCCRYFLVFGLFHGLDLFVCLLVNHVNII